jgi:hypothetical protein
MPVLSRYQTARLQVLGYSRQEIRYFALQIKKRRRRKKYAKVRYSVTPAIVRNLIALVSESNRWFRRRTGLFHDTFMIYVVRPVEDWYARMRREYDGRRVRDSQLVVKIRLFRFMSFLKNTPLVALASESGQDPTSVLRDVRKLARIVAWTLEMEWLGLPQHGTVEYQHLLGNGEFASLPFVVASFDITYIFAPRPTINPKDYWIAHKKRYGYVVAVGSDGFGNSLAASEPMPGAASDPLIMHASGLHDDVRRYLIGCYVCCCCDLRVEYMYI